MILKKINLDTVVIKETFAKGKSITLKEILMSLILIMIAIYFSSIAWIVLIRGGSEALNTESFLLISAIISIITGVLYFMLRFPTVLFLSKLNKRLLYLPIKPHNILLARYRYLLAIQLIINFIITIPLLFLTSLNILMYISFLIFLTLLIISIDYILIILLFLIGCIINKKYIQFAFISTTVFGGFIMGLFLKLKGMSILGEIIIKFLNSNDLMSRVTILISFFCFISILHVLMILICNRWFKDIYYKTLSYKDSKKMRKRVYNIYNPYIFLEIRFIVRNKSFLIYSILKSMFLMYIMIKLISSSIVIDNSLKIMLFIIFMSCFNSLSITAISRDLKQIRIMKTMPVNFKNMIFAKVIVSTMINFGLCSLLLLVLKFRYGIPVITYIFFNVAYSIFSSTIGVYLDLATPNDSYDNLNDLIRNNGGTLVQFFIAIITLVITILLRIYFGCYSMIINIILLLISALIIKYKKVVIV